MVRRDGEVEISLDRPPPPEVFADRRRRRRRRRTLITVAVVVALAVGAGAAGAAYVSSVPVPPLSVADNSTTVFYADGRTVLARLAPRPRLIIDPATLPRHVTAAVLSAQDRHFRDGGVRHSPSEIARRHARLVSPRPPGSARRTTVMAAKMEHRYGKDKILGAYLNAVPFGRGTDGIGAAAYAYFGKPATELTVEEAIVLAGQLGSPDGGATDPTANPDAARRRWEHTKQGLVDPLRVLDAAAAARLAYPATLLDPLEGARRVPVGPPAGPNGHIARQVLAELASLPEVTRKDRAERAGGGYTVVSTIEQSTQQAMERYADETAAGSVLAGQPTNLQAAAVAVQPKTGRVLAYYGGHDGRARDYAGPGDPKEPDIGGHPPGASFAVYTLAAALKAGISVRSWWDPGPTKPSPERRVPVINRGASCPPTRPDAGTVVDVVRCGLNAPLFVITNKVGPARVVDAARAAGINHMWDSEGKRVDLRAIRSGGEVAPARLDTEIGFGQYPITVLDHANGMATFAARGERAAAHFVTSVSRDGRELYRERLVTESAGLTGAQVDDLTWVLSQNDAGRLPDARPTATVDGTWEAALTGSSAHAWIAGFTPELGVAVWVGNKREELPLKDRTKRAVTGWTLPAEIYRGFVSTVLAGTPRADFPPPRFVGDANAGTATPPAGKG